MRTVRTTRILSALLVGLVSANPLIAQVVSGHTLTGDWVRVVSNNNPNDRMRIAISGTGGVLTQVPGPARPHWKTGQTLWQGIQTNGSLQVLGSDGNYYQATMTLNGPDELKLAIQLRTAGDDQTWRRAGPNIDGDWVRVAPPGTPGDGTRIQVQGVAASVRYLTATAPRVLRVGSRIWQGIGASGGLAALGSDAKYHPSTWSLIAPDRLQVNAPALAGGSGQIWVRPAAVASARGAVRTPPANPNAPGSGLTPPSNLPGLPSTPATPPISPAAPVACFSTSMPHDASDVQWGLSIYKAGSDLPVEESMGIRSFLTGGLPGSGAGGRAPADLERILLPGLQDGFVDVWEQRPSRRSAWKRHTGMTKALLDQEIQRTMTSGYRPTDIEGQLTGSTNFYAGVWEANREGLAWKLEYDLTGQQYDAAVQNYRNNGYRLIDMEAYETPAGLRYAAIWWTSCDDTNWKEVRDLDVAAFDTRYRAERAQGFQVIDFESYGTPSGQRYAAIWQRMPPGRDWEVRIDLGMKWFLNSHYRYSDLGMRLVDFESYDTPNGVRYAGVWAENDARYDYAMNPLLDAEIDGYLTTHAIPGMSVVIMRDGEVLYRRGFGWADEAEEKNAHSGTIYMTASVAKVFGATIAARLQLRRDASGQPLIDLSRPTSDYVSVPSSHTHTLEQLMRKHGCIGHYPDIAEPTAAYYQWRTQPVQALQAPMLSRVLPNGTTLNCVPGQFYHYSSHGFTYVGAALEQVTGKDIATIVQDELTLPFSLTSLQAAAPQIPVAVGPGGSWIDRYDMAQPYDSSRTNAGQTQEIGYSDTSWKVLGGGLQSNTFDLAQFGWLTLNGNIAGDPDTELWQGVMAPASWGIANPGRTPNPRPEGNPTVGLAWVLRALPASGGAAPLPARRLAEHGGSWAGSRTNLQIYRDAGIVISIMSNSRWSPSATGNRHGLAGLSDRLGAIVLRNPPP